MKLVYYCGFMVFFDNLVVLIIWFFLCIFGWIYFGGIIFWYMEYFYEDGEIEDKF